MHSNLRGGNDGVIGVGLVTGIHAALESTARVIEGRLGDGVVLGKELEDDGVANRNVLKLRGLEDETSRAANLDGMAGSKMRHGGGGALVDGVSDAVTASNLCLVLGGSGDCFRHYNLFVDSLGHSLGATGVSPDDEDLSGLLFVLLKDGPVMLDRGDDMFNRGNLVLDGGHHMLRSLLLNEVVAPSGKRSSAANPARHAQGSKGNGQRCRELHIRG